MTVDDADELMGSPANVIMRRESLIFDFSIDKYNNVHIIIS